MASSPGSPRIVQWLAIPALLGGLALVGMGISTESKSDFEQRNDVQDAQDGGSGDNPQSGRSQPDSSDTGPAPGQGETEAQAGGSGPTDSDQQQADRENAQEPSEQEGRSGGGQPVIIRTENGDIVIRLDGDDGPTLLTPADSGVGPGRLRNLGGEDEPGVVGVRITADGDLDPVDSIDQLDPANDFVFGGAEEGGLDVTRPDGSVIELQPTEDGDLSGADVLLGEPVPLAPLEDGNILVQPAEAFGSEHQASPSAEPLVIETPAGPIRFELEADGDLVANQPDLGDEMTLGSEDLVALRIDEDGNLEVVPIDEIGEDDTVLVPAKDGIDLVRPDGSRVEFRVDGENDGVTATEITADGQEIELVPNPDGSVTLSDGTTVGPIDFAEDGGTIERILDQTADLPWPWVFGAIALLATLSIGTAIYLHKTRPDDPLDYSQFAAVGVNVDEFQQFLAVIRSDPDPSRAIRLAFYAAERGLAGLPPRRPDETPFEWHHRVEQDRPDLAQPLGPICDHFAMVRFAPGQATGADRDAVADKLHELHMTAVGSSGQSTAQMAGV